MELPPKVPNLILRCIREEQRHETRAEFAEALTRKAEELGEPIFPTERSVARLERGEVRYPGVKYRRVLSALCGLPISELGFESAYAGAAEDKDSVALVQSSWIPHG
ncbi:MAG TPA: hypothetical protein VGS19_23790, partial [Streptosporangiaceae bacterium]|nr:hypothetical protein [Streptosporangiaceae bacterium]